VKYVATGTLDRFERSRFVDLVVELDEVFVRLNGPFRHGILLPSRFSNAYDCRRSAVSLTIASPPGRAPIPLLRHDRAACQLSSALDLRVKRWHS
jgi:hypothetical protein